MQVFEGWFCRFDVLYVINWYKSIQFFLLYANAW